MPTVIYFWAGLSHGPRADIRAPDELRLLALTVATDETDGYKRFMKSAKANHIDVKVSLIIYLPSWRVATFSFFERSPFGQLISSLSLYGLYLLMFFLLQLLCNLFLCSARGTSRRFLKIKF